MQPSSTRETEPESEAVHETSSSQEEMIDIDDFEQPDADWTYCEESASMSDDDENEVGGSKNTVRYIFHKRPSKLIRNIMSQDSNSYFLLNDEKHGISFLDVYRLYNCLELFIQQTKH